MTVKHLYWISIAFLPVVIISIICITYFYYNSHELYELRDYFNQNSIKINMTNNLDINKVNIHWVSDTKSGQIILNGKNTNLIYKEYGPNIFFIVYEKDTIKKFTYGKTNNWHGHEHVISISKQNQNIKAEVKIIGPDVN